MSSFAINVSNISSESTQTKIDQFFSFCGKISSITLTPGPEKTQSAVIVFEKESAAKTALLLNEGTLDGAHLHVSSETVSSGASASDENILSQEDKPKAGIIAEYLAHGYVLSDTIVQRAIDLDHKQGISSKFLTFIQDLDQKAGAKAVGPEKTISGKIQETVQPIIDTVVGQAKAVDEKNKISSTATDYYTHAIGTPFGQKVFQFYTTTQKQVVDVHTEAKRIAEAKKAAAAPATPVAAATPVVAAPVA